MNLYKAYAISNLLALLFLLFFPAKSASGSLINLLIFNGIFFGITIAFSLALVRFDCTKKNQRIVSTPTEALRALKPLSIVSAFSPFLIFIDRVFVRGISYADGLRVARYQWLESGAGSILGISGNILSAFSYVGFFIAAYFLEGKEKIKYIAIFGLIIVALAALNGGRSNVLLAGVLWVGAAVIRGRKTEGRRKNSKYIYVLACLAFYYVAQIIRSSADLGEISISELVMLGIGELYGVPENFLTDVPMPELVYYLLYVAVYLYHGQWTAQAALELDSYPGHYAFVSIPLVFLEKAGILNLTSESTAFDHGVYLSLPAAFYYDFGYFGAFLCAAILGIFLGLGARMLKYSNEISTIKITVILATFFFLTLSPIAPAYGFTYFSYIIFGFVSLAVLAIFSRRFRLKY